MSKLLKRLLGLLFPGADGDTGDDVDPPPDAPQDPSGDDVSGDELDDEFEFDLVDTDPKPATGKGETAEQRAARLEAELEAARRQSTAPSSPQASGKTPAQLQWEEEEATLRNPETPQDERWRIESNRRMRESFQMSQTALMQAQDLNDRTAFQSKFSTDPRRAKYADRVEAHIAEMRKNGANAAREGVYFYLLGKDIAEGKLKPAAKRKAPAADVPRGRSPNARSDVSARGAKSEHEKRRARLENMNI
jgi:hypothetical protein